jgi:hypothetical protein
MAFIDMQTELRGAVPKLPISFAPTLINRAWRRIRESHLWSFNIIEHAWFSPAMVTAGTVTVTQGLSTITFDATAITALNASNSLVSAITQRQIRVGTGGIYSIIAYNSGTGAATLDRIWFDPSAAASAYQVYQVYYPAPVLDYLMPISVRNPQMFLDLDLTKTREWLDRCDPQRFQYSWPSAVIPWGIDTRGAGTTTPSATLGFQLYEFWGQPIQPLTYQCYGLRRGVDLVLPTDTLPVQVGEDLIAERAKPWAYEWAMANQSITPRNSGPDWKFLTGEAKDNYKHMLIDYKRNDKNFLNNYRILGNSGVRSLVAGHYNSIAHTAGSD